MAAPDLGTGSTITFATSTGFAMRLRDINWGGGSRPAIDTTHYGSTARTKLPGDIVDYGAFEAEFEFDPAAHATAANFLLTNAEETITINWGGSGNTSAFTGFVSDMSAEAPNEDLMVMRATIVVDGAITWS
jgi:hypothetical protein